MKEENLSKKKHKIVEREKIYESMIKNGKIIKRKKGTKRDMKSKFIHIEN